MASTASDHSAFSCSAAVGSSGSIPISEATERLLDSSFTNNNCLANALPAERADPVHGGCGNGPAASGRSLGNARSFGSDRRDFAGCETPELGLSQFPRWEDCFLSGRWRLSYDRLRRSCRRQVRIDLEARLEVLSKTSRDGDKLAACPATVLKLPRGAEECGYQRRVPWR